MSFTEQIKKSFSILGLNKDAMEEVANDQDATQYGLYTLLLAGVAIAISSISILGIIIVPIFLVISFFIGYSIYNFIARFVFKGEATGEQYMRVISNAFVIYWLTFIPIIGIFMQSFASLWLMIVNIMALKNVHKLSTASAIILGLLPFIITIVFVMLFAMFGIMSPTSFMPTV